MPIYNGGKYLNVSLKSIQNQKMKDIEIIIINDNSNDDSLKIIREYMKSDARIKLLENKKNRKILYCKSIGVLYSNGKYIIELDQDDMFIDDDAFNIIYDQSEKNNLDILQFNYNFGEDYPKLIKNLNSGLNNSIVIKEQPELKYSMFKQKLFLLWGNLFKADLYKLIIYNLWPIIINYKIIFDEDFIITFFIVIYAKRCGFIKHILIFHYINCESASQSYLNNTENYLSTLFTANLYYDYHIDSYPKDIHIILNYIYWIMGVFKKCKKLYPKLFNFFFGKLLSNDYLPMQDKIKLLNIFNISENCDLYKYIKKVTNKNTNINNYKTYKLSIIIIISIYNNQL